VRLLVVTAVGAVTAGGGGGVVVVFSSSSAVLTLTSESDEPRLGSRGGQRLEAEGRGGDMLRYPVPASKLSALPLRAEGSSAELCFRRRLDELDSEQSEQRCSVAAMDVRDRIDGGTSADKFAAVMVDDDDVCAPSFDLADMTEL
jgi:hypothetical protein